MHTLDILFIVAAAFFIYTGVRRGLIGELFRLVALAAGFCVAFMFYPDLADKIHFNPRYLSGAVAFLLLYLAAALSILGLGWLLKKAVHLTPLGWADYLFGGTIGLLKAAIIFWVVCLSLSSFPASASRLHANRSLVYKTYKQLPGTMKLADMMKLRNSLKKEVDHDVPRKVKQTKQAIEQLKDKVDSVKNSQPKFR
jgi:membrane protein required for colicin V production